MARKIERIALRLTENEIEKVQEVARVTGCNLSEAVRQMVRNTRLEPVSVIEVKVQPAINEMILA